MSEVEKGFVIRRDLHPYNIDIPHYGGVAHSAWLLKTTNGWKILEYGVESNPNGVTLRNININRQSDDFTKFTDGNFTWTKQKYGSSLIDRDCPVTDNKKWRTVNRVSLL